MADKDRDRETERERDKDRDRKIKKERGRKMRCLLCVSIYDTLMKRQNFHIKFRTHINLSHYIYLIIKDKI